MQDTNNKKRSIEAIMKSIVPSEEDKEIEEQNAKDEKIKKSKILFGNGYEHDEYILLYDKFVLLNENYPLRTKMHEQWLKTYCMQIMRAEIAIKNGVLSEAKEWYAMAEKTANSAKLNPSQLSVADLSGGLTCFSTMVQMTEKYDGDITIRLNKYQAKPQDRVDYTLYMFVDYIMDILGKPHKTYKDLWEFMYKNQDKNIKQFGKDVVPKENSSDPNAILVDGDE